MTGRALLDLMRLQDRLLLKGMRKTKNSKDDDDNNDYYDGGEIDRIERDLTSRQESVVLLSRHLYKCT